MLTATISKLTEVETKNIRDAMGNNFDNYQTSADMTLAQNFIFDQVSEMINVSLISKEIESLTKFQSTKRGKI